MATKVTVKVNDDAPADLALGTKKLAAGEAYEIDRTHLPALSAYVTEVEAEDATVPAVAPKKAAAKKGR